MPEATATVAAGRLMMLDEWAALDEDRRGRKADVSVFLTGKRLPALSDALARVPPHAS